MGYQTDFYGAFKVEPTMKPEHIAYLNQFNETRRMKRNPKLLEDLPDPIRIATGLPVGPEGAYYVGSTASCGQDDARDCPNVVDENHPATGQPEYSVWCQWVPTADGNGLEWDGAEKFYEYIPWLKYLISDFLAPWGYKLNGEVKWEGEDHSDHGLIRVKDNNVGTLVGKVVYE